MDDVMTTTTLGLKEWGAAIHALLQGRQSILLRKGGIHEKAFTTPQHDGGVLLFPTVAHTHAARTRPEHHDLLPLGDADADDASLTFRAGLFIHRSVEVAQPDRLPELADLHIWTDQSIKEDRVDFRPTKALTVLVVRTLALPDPVVLPRVEGYGGCKSWLDVEMGWRGEGAQVMRSSVLDRIADRVTATVG